MTAAQAIDMLKVLNDVFFLVRISDPETNEVWDMNENGVFAPVSICYHVWKKTSPCAHCSTKRTCRERIITDKYEVMDGCVFHITSKPVEIDGHVFAFEIVTKLDNSEDIKRREILLQSQEKNIEIIRTLVDDYESVFHIDLTNGMLTVTKLSPDDEQLLSPILKEDMDYSEAANLLLREQICNSDYESLRLFCDREFLRALVANRKIFKRVFRVGTENDFKYHEMKVVKANEGEEVSSVVIGIADRDDSIRAKMQAEQIMREQEKELEAARNAAEAANKAKTAFLFNMSHDIRTPMNAIIGFNDMALRHPDNQEKIRECLEKIGMSSQHLLSIINDVLDMARIESGKVIIEEEKVAVAASAEELCNIFEQNARDKNITIESDFTSLTHGTVLADKLRVNRVLMNLLSNSVKYTAPGGKIRFIVRELPNGEDGQATYEFVVADNGMGMSEEYLAHIFEAFTRADSAAVGQIQGTGLGMAITRELIDLMNGTIHIESALGVGTTVTVGFTFRTCEKEAAPETEEKTDTDASFLSGKLVLLTEDNELNREIAMEVLSEYGMAVEAACDGSEAVEKFRDSLGTGKHYDLILMDVNMPVMGGYEATGEIRKLEKELHMHTPILAMTANAFAEDRAGSLRAGMDEHIAKPINVDNLIRTLSKFMA